MQYSLVKRSLPPIVKPTLLQAQELVLSSVAHYRAASGRPRKLPDFIIIGGQKCGTTELYDKLCQHPQVAGALTKEVHFFDTNFRKSEAWYRAHFPYQHAHGITGEASPYYLFHPHVPRRVAHMVPNAKLIVLLRDPVKRAYSHYHHELRLGYETLSFEEAIAREEQRLAGETERMLHDEYYCSYAHQHYSYRAKGLYLEQIKAWHQYTPKDRMLILKAEDLYTDRRSTLQKVMNFLGLEPWEPSVLEEPKSFPYPKMKPSLMQSLADYYHPHNQRLAAYLGADFTWDTY